MLNPDDCMVTGPQRTKEHEVIVGTIALLAELYGPPLGGIMYLKGAISTGWVAAWPRSMNLNEVVSDDGPMNISKTVTYTVDIGNWRVIVCAHNWADAMELESDMRMHLTKGTIE